MDYLGGAVNASHNHRMSRVDKRYIWQQNDWPHWTYDHRRLAPLDRHVDGMVAMVLDATQGHHMPLTAERLSSWHAAMFPTGYSGLSKIRVGQWRDDAQGPVQVVSGPMHRQKVHYEAPQRIG